jgi:hypothetical protein
MWGPWATAASTHSHAQSGPQSTGTPLASQLCSVGKKGWPTSNSCGCMRLLLLPWALFMGRFTCSFCLLLLGTQTLGSVRGFVWPDVPAAGAAGKVVAGSGLFGGRGSEADTNSSDTGFISPCASCAIALIRSTFGLRCQEGSLSLHLPADETPPLAMYACTAGSRVLTTALMRSAVGLAQEWRYEVSTLDWSRFQVGCN